MYKKHQVHSVDQGFSPGVQWLRYLTNFKQTLTNFKQTVQDKSFY